MDLQANLKTPLPNRPRVSEPAVVLRSQDMAPACQRGAGWSLVTVTYRVPTDHITIQVWYLADDIEYMVYSRWYRISGIWYIAQGI